MNTHSDEILTFTCCAFQDDLEKMLPVIDQMRLRPEYVDKVANYELLCQASQWASEVATLYMMLRHLNENSSFWEEVALLLDEKHIAIYNRWKEIVTETLKSMDMSRDRTRFVSNAAAFQQTSFIIFELTRKQKK